jgi:hypothetical protein
VFGDVGQPDLAGGLGAELALDEVIIVDGGPAFLVARSRFRGSPGPPKSVVNNDPLSVYLICRERRAVPGQWSVTSGVPAEGVVTPPQGCYISASSDAVMSGRSNQSSTGIHWKGAIHGSENQLQIPAHQRLVWPRFLGHIRAVLGGDRA